MMSLNLVVAVIMLMVCWSMIPSASAAYTQGINLGACADFAVMTGTAANFNGVVTQIPIGNVGVSPGISIAGSYVLGTGSVENNSPAAVQCASDELLAYLEAQAAVCPASNVLANPDLGGVTLESGVYCSSFIQLNAGALTLDGQGNSSSVWVFQSATTMETGTSTSFNLINGAQAKNVYWQLGTALTVGTSGSFVGTVLAGTAITLSSDSVLNGRALAQTAVDCASGNTINAPIDESTASPTKQPSNSPTRRPTVKVTKRPTVLPTRRPTVLPTRRPTVTVTKKPTVPPTRRPTAGATKRPSSQPSFRPSAGST